MNAGKAYKNRYPIEFTDNAETVKSHTVPKANRKTVRVTARKAQRAARTRGRR